MEFLETQLNDFSTSKNRLDFSWFGVIRKLKQMYFLSRFVVSIKRDENPVLYYQIHFEPHIIFVVWHAQSGNISSLTKTPN